MPQGLQYYDGPRVELASVRLGEACSLREGPCDSGSIEGSIVYDTSNTSPGSNDRWRLVGSRVQSKINSIGYTYRDIYFDTRFSGGTFAPPFFPGTNYEYAPGVPETLTINSIALPAATAMSWFRSNN